MSLVNMNEILLDAKKNNYAVGGFDCWNLESIEAVVEAAEEMCSPVVILTGPYGMGRSKERIEYFGAITKTAAQRVSVPIAIHLNEANDFSLVIKAIQSGFTSVMLETSELPLKENINITKQIVKIAHSVNISVESQLGHMPIPEDINDSNIQLLDTNPVEAEQFVKNTGVDALAISFGNIHFGKSRNLNFDLIKEVSKITNIPLVVHGGSGFPKNYINKAIKCGCYKFNVGFVFREKFLKSLKENVNPSLSLDSESSYIFIETVLERAKNEMKKEVIEWMKVLESAGKAR
jgi:fructose-bisphosphate aldolase, class II